MRRGQHALNRRTLVAFITIVTQISPQKIALMKCAHLILLSFLIVLALPTHAQNEIVFQVNHMMNGESFVLGQTYNVESSQVRVDRLEYYLCDFVVTHDGGQETELTDVYILANAGDNGAYSLGQWNIEEVEAISFGVGVDSGHNVGIDPSTYPVDHPLAPQFPSMHWGWASGYRFLAFEGFSGANLAATSQVHALGDQNFHHQNHTILDPQTVDGTVTITLDANYENMFLGLPLEQGFIEHSNTHEAAETMWNMRNSVFGQALPLSIKEPFEEPALQVFPNPTTESLVIEAKTLQSSHQWVVFNATGQKVMGGLMQSRTSLRVDALRAGPHVLIVQDAHGVPLASQRFVKE